MNTSHMQEGSRTSKGSGRSRLPNGNGPSQSANGKGYWITERYGVLQVTLE